MKKLMTMVLAFSSTAFLAGGLVGCGQEDKIKEKETVSTPTGTTSTETTKKVTSSGSNPPTSTEGKRVEPTNK